MQELSDIQNNLTRYYNLKNSSEEVGILAQMAEEEDDEETARECATEVARLEREVQTALVEASFTGPHDASNAIVSIHPGAGGTESCDWAGMLYRMYTRWAESEDYRVSEWDRLPGDEAGIKSVTFSVEGPYAYGRLAVERGVHRLVRISPFDSAARRHTSFASVEVLPEVDDEIEIDVNEDDLRIDTFRSSGAGGQHVNVTDSAVRITHIPTGIVVSCQNERSQMKNRATAMKHLKAKLYKREEEQRLKDMEALQGEKKEIAWGSQIRSYVIQPYTMVKDHRANVEIGNVQGVLDGDLNDLINAGITWANQSRD